MKIPFLLLLLAAPLASARLGETIDQCRARYGKETRIFKDEEGNIHEYAKAGFVIGILFYEGKAAVIIANKPPKGILGIPDEITPAELESLISANGRGSAWTKLGSDIVKDKWLSDDGRGLATYDTLNHRLSLYDTAANERILETKAKKEKAKLKGF
jgi:hypothetical protein